VRAGENEHGSGGFAKQLLVYQGHLLEEVDHLVERGYVVEDGHHGRNLIEEILAIAEQRIENESEWENRRDGAQAGCGERLKTDFSYWEFLGVCRSDQIFVSD
jgi:hypothetical protein